MKVTLKVLATVLLVGCDPGVIASNSSSPDGITLTRSTPERVTGSYGDGQGVTLQFDSARVGDDLYLDLTGINGRQIVHIATTATGYEFSYLGGRLKLSVTKEAIAQARAESNWRVTPWPSP